MIRRRVWAVCAWMGMTIYGTARAEAPAPAADVACRAGNQALFYAPHPAGEARLPAGFADSLWAQLRDPAQELGYCLQPARDGRPPQDTARYGETLFFQALAKDEGGALTVSIAALRVREYAQGKLPEAEARPLVTLRVVPGGTAGLSSVLAKKVAENLRGQYVADLLIRSHPAGVLVRSSSGLEGTTPLEWVVPLGTMQVTLSKPGYLEARRSLELATPGQNTYDLQLAKRRFYHSRFIYPALIAGAASAAAFVFENHYYGVYQTLGPADAKNRPAAFADNFRTAKSYERIGYATLGLAAFSLALCFTF